MNSRTKQLYSALEKIVGQPLYLVGGSVRDILLEKEPKDYDFATPLLPEEIEQLIRNQNKKPYLVGKRFGTIGVKIEGQLLEITTFRSEKYNVGNRKPSVEFGIDISQDLSRRDFTINALAWRSDNLIDPFGGREDLKKGIIRAVGHPRQRFKEDPLRLLRAIRFATQFKFSIEEDTQKKIVEQAYKILSISKERWMQELDKILLSTNVVYGLQLLRLSGLLNFMIPELALQFNYEQNCPTHHKLNLWEHTSMVVGLTPVDLHLRWAALLHDIAKPFVREDKVGRSTYIKHDLLGSELVERLARHLRWSNERREYVKQLVLNHMREDSPLRSADTNPLSRGFANEQVV